jgi:diguanylate cyclase (GGDEF)-like protein
MHMPRRPNLLRSRSRLRDGAGLIRARIWLAMLGLAVVPMLGTILLTVTFAQHPAAVASEREGWQTASAAADLRARMTVVESRFLGLAADVTLRPLLDGISGPEERALASGAVGALGDEVGGLVVGACLVKAGDDAGISLLEPSAAGTDAGTGTDPTTTAPCPASLMSVVEASTARPGIISRTALGTGPDRVATLTTPLLGGPKRDAGTLVAAISIPRLFETTPSAAAAAGSAILVDLASDSIVASSRMDGIEDGTASSGGQRPVGDLRVRLTGIMSGHPGTVRALETAGWVTTAAPVWSDQGGRGLGLVHIWPFTPPTTNPLLVGALVGFGVTVLLVAVVLAWTFLRPFDDLARSQSQLEVLYREAREDSLHDGLTGLGNHRSFQEELDRQLELFRRHKVPVALLLIDLDDLKVVNDGEGHPAGDRLLVSMAASIRDVLRYGDRAFRIGGDEFAVILPHTDASDALVAANRLRHFCLRPPAGERAIQFSGGISSVPQLAADRTILFRQADAALYRCKRSSRGTVGIFDPDRDLVPGDIPDQAAVLAIQDVIRARRLTPVFQPIVDLRDGAVLGFEGLIRPGPAAPFSNPGQLFAAAASAGRTSELDLACFEVVAAGSAQIDAHQVVSINLSPQTLEMEGFSASWLLEILARYRVSPGRVIVELTEREAITDLTRLRESVASLQNAGVRIAADDVGAGNAGLRLLSQLRFDIVKIDLSLVQEGVQRDSSRNVVRSLMDLAARQGAVAIAEGLETAEQLRALRELGMTTGQGYLLGRPGQNLGMASVDIEALASGALIVQNTPAHGAGAPASQPASPAASHPASAPASHPASAPASHPASAPASHPLGAPAARSTEVTILERGVA